MPDSAAAIGGVSLGGILYYTCVLYGGALMLGLDTLVPKFRHRDNITLVVAGVYVRVLRPAA